MGRQPQGRIPRVNACHWRPSRLEAPRVFFQACRHPGTLWTAPATAPTHAPRGLSALFCPSFLSFTSRNQDRRLEAVPRLPVQRSLCLLPCTVLDHQPRPRKVVLRLLTTMDLNVETMLHLLLACSASSRGFASVVGHDLFSALDHRAPWPVAISIASGWLVLPRLETFRSPE